MAGTRGHRENRAGSRDEGKRTLQGRRSSEGGLLQPETRVERDLAPGEGPLAETNRSVPNQGGREILDDLPVLQASRFAQFPEEAWVLLVSSSAVVAVRLEVVASLVAVLAGAVEGAAENQYLSRPKRGSVGVSLEPRLPVGGGFACRAPCAYFFICLLKKSQMTSFASRSLLVFPIIHSGRY